MTKKLQVFISSTFTDLIQERQAAVEAILSAGHIPAGMELFNAGNDSQLDTIKRWIDASDVYMLILGGRYGSIEPKSELSYTEVEYRYALEKEKPVFAVFISKEALNEKVRNMGADVIEQDSKHKFDKFKEFVLSKISKQFSDTKDIQLAVLQTLNRFDKEFNLTGWISGAEIPDFESISIENNLLKERLKYLEDNLLKTNFNEKTENDKIRRAGQRLCYREIKIPDDISQMFHGRKSINCIDLFFEYKNKWINGIIFQGLATSRIDLFLLEEVAPELYLSDFIKNTGSNGYIISESGKEFILDYEQAWNNGLIMDFLCDI